MLLRLASLTILVFGVAELVSTAPVNYTCLSAVNIPSSAQALAVGNCLSAAGTSLGSATVKSCKKSTKTKDKSAKKATKLFYKCLTAYHKAAEKLGKKKSPGVASAAQKCLATNGSYAKCRLSTLASGTASKQALKADAKWAGKKCVSVLYPAKCEPSNSRSSSLSTRATAATAVTTKAGASATTATTTAPSSASATQNCGSTGTGSAMSTTSMNGALNYHNDMRAKILAGTYQANGTKLGPAVSLPPMTWNCTLAASAQVWADGCVFQHDPSNGGRFGENIFMAMAPTTAYLASVYPVEQLGLLASQAFQDEFQTSVITTLVIGKFNATLGHATQMVWATSTQLGCGMATNCPNNGNYMSLVVCRYIATGNWGGQQPFWPSCPGSSIAPSNLTCV